MNITKRNPIKAAIIKTSTFVQRPVQASSLIALSPMRSARSCPVPFRLALQARLAQPKKPESKGMPVKYSAGAMTGAAALLVLHVGPAYADDLSEAFETLKLVSPLLGLIGAAISLGIAKKTIDTLVSGQTKLEEAIKALGSEIKASESRLGSEIKASESRLRTDLDQLKTDLATVKTDVAYIKGYNARRDEESLILGPFKR
jgi:phage-related minor tail protein